MEAQAPGSPPIAVGVEVNRPKCVLFSEDMSPSDVKGWLAQDFAGLEEYFIDGVRGDVLLEYACDPTNPNMLELFPGIPDLGGGKGLLIGLRQALKRLQKFNDGHLGFASEKEEEEG